MKILKLPRKLDQDYCDDFYRFPDLPSLTEVNIPEGVRIADFSGCTNLISITLPESFQAFDDGEGYGELVGNFNLERVTFAGRPPSYVEGEDYIYGLSSSFCGLCMYADSVWYTEKYEKEWRKVLRNIGYGGVHGLIGTDGETTVVGGGGDARYDLSDAPKDRAIANVEISGDAEIDEFVLKDGKVYDCGLYVTNKSKNVAKLTLPDGYTYKALKGTKPLLVPGNSCNILTITRVADKVFLIAREELETVG